MSLVSVRGGQKTVERRQPFRGADVPPVAAVVLAADPLLRHGGAQHRRQPALTVVERGDARDSLVHARRERVVFTLLVRRGRRVRRAREHVGNELFARRGEVQRSEKVDEAKALHDQSALEADELARNLVARRDSPLVAAVTPCQGSLARDAQRPQTRTVGLPERDRGDVILGGAIEEMDLESLKTELCQRVKTLTAEQPGLGEAEVQEQVYRAMSGGGTRSRRLKVPRLASETSGLVARADSLDQAKAALSNIRIESSTSMGYAAGLKHTAPGATLGAIAEPPALRRMASGFGGAAPAHFAAEMPMYRGLSAAIDDDDEAPSCRYRSHAHGGVQIPAAFGSRQHFH